MECAFATRWAHPCTAGEMGLFRTVFWLLLCAAYVDALPDSEAGLLPPEAEQATSSDAPASSCQGSAKNPAGGDVTSCTDVDNHSAEQGAGHGPDTLLRAGQEAFDAGNFEQAVALFAQIRAHSPDWQALPQVLLLHGMALAKLKQGDLATETLQKALALSAMRSGNHQLFTERASSAVSGLAKLMAVDAHGEEGLRDVDLLGRKHEEGVHDKGISFSLHGT